MRYLSIISLVIIFFTSCSVLSKYQAGENKYSKLSDSLNVRSISLDESEQRKFDYYFYEGIRYKALNEVNKSFMYFAEAFKIDSTCSACAYELSRILLANNSVEDAQKLMEKAVQYDPYNRYYILLLSRIYQNLGNGEAAVDIARRLLNNNGNSSVEDIYYVAELEVQNGFIDAAIDNLKIIENRLGITEPINLRIYQLYLQKEDFKNAEKELYKLIKNNPYNSNYRILLGDFYLENGNFKKAFSEYNEVLKIEPVNGNVYFSLGNYYLEKGDTLSFKKNFFKGFESKNVDFTNKFRKLLSLVGNNDNSKELFEKEEIKALYRILIRVHPYEVDVYHSFGNYLMSLGEKDLARDIFQQGLEIDASQPLLWQDYLILLSEFQDYNTLSNKASQAITFYPEEPVFRLLYGVALFQLKDYRAAANVLLNGLELEKVKSNLALKGQFHAYLGDIFYSMKNVDSCFYHYEEALKIDENNIIVLNNYSYYLALEGLNLEKAEHMSSKTIQLEPGNPTYLDTYAWVLFKRKRFNEAKFIIERAVENLDEPNGVILEHYGDILYKTGDLEGALIQWQKALELGEHSKTLEKKIELKKFVDE